MSTLVDLPLADVRPGNNDRKEFDPVGLAELAASIDESGLAMPIKVRADSDGYEIVAGERRFRAFQLLGRATIPAIVDDLADEHASAQMLIENLQRKDLNPVEEANAYRERIEQYGYTVDTVARIAGVSAKRVTDRLSLLNLAPDILELAGNGNLKPLFATHLARVDHNRQVIALRALQRQPNMRWDDFVAIVEKLLAEQSQESMFDAETLVAEVWTTGRPAAGKRYTRTQVLAALADTVAALEGLEDRLDTSQAEALAHARDALSWEKTNRPVAA